MTTKSVPKSKKSITLEKEIETKVRRIQARLIEKTDQTWSLSKHTGNGWPDADKEDESCRLAENQDTSRRQDSYIWR